MPENIYQTAQGSIYYAHDRTERAHLCGGRPEPRLYAFDICYDLPTLKKKGVGAGFAGGGGGAGGGSVDARVRQRTLAPCTLLLIIFPARASV